MLVASVKTRRGCPGARQGSSLLRGSEVGKTQEYLVSLAPFQQFSWQSRRPVSTEYEERGELMSDLWRARTAICTSSLCFLEKVASLSPEKNAIRTLQADRSGLRWKCWSTYFFLIFHFLKNRFVRSCRYIAVLSNHGLFPHLSLCRNSMSSATRWCRNILTRSQIMPTSSERRWGPVDRRIAFNIL